MSPLHLLVDSVLYYHRMSAAPPVFSAATLNEWRPYFARFSDAGNSVYPTTYEANLVAVFQVFPPCSAWGELDYIFFVSRSLPSSNADPFSTLH